MKVEKIVPKSTKLKDLQEYIAELSSVVRDKNPKNSKKLFERLLTESVGGTASRVMEYIPCSLPQNEMGVNIPQLFGFFDENRQYYTNLREVLNWGWTMKDALKTVDFTNYAVVRVEAPYFLYAQASTHTQITTISHSQRYATCDRGYWCPPEIAKNFKQEFWNSLCVNAKPSNLQTFMRDAGITRKEILDRGRDSLQNRVYIFGGYKNNPNAWQHFFEQRKDDNHTQLEMRELATLMYEELN